VYLTPRWRGSPWNLVSAQESEETRMMGLPDVRKSFKIGLAVLIQYRRVSVIQPPSQPRHRSKYALCISASRSKKRSEETQTLCAGCSKAEPKIFTPPHTPFPEARDGQSLISWRESLPSPTDPVWWGSMHAISSYPGNRTTHPQTQTHTGPISIHCAAA